MAMIPAKCTNCGANIQVDESKEAGICEACGTAFITEKVINNYNTINNYHADVVNIINEKNDFEIVSGTLVKYNGASPDIVIPSNVSILAKGAFSNCKSLRSVYIPSSVTKIEHLCFPMNFNQNVVIKVDSLQFWCELTIEDSLVYGGAVILEVAGEVLQCLVIPEGVKQIKAKTFSSCKTIKSVTFPNSLLSIGDAAFAGCDGITELNLPLGLYQIGYCAFNHCRNIREIYMPDTVMQLGKQCFGECINLTNVRISNNLRKISQAAFLGCSQLRKIEIPENVTEIEFDAFANCTSLEDVSIRNAKCKIGEQAFRGTPYGAKKGGCYIATCVYGSYDCPQVWTLRRYRDDTLGATWYGRLFIRAYYAISPTLVKWFGKTRWFKRMWQDRLDKMVAKLNNDGVKNTPYQDREW